MEDASFEKTPLNWGMVVGLWVLDVVASVAGTTGALWLIDTLLISAPWAQIAILVLLSIAGALLLPVLVACAVLLIKMVSQRRWNVRIRLVVSFLDLIVYVGSVYVGWLLVTTFLMPRVFPAYLHFHPVNTWIIDGSAATALGVKLVAVLVGLLVTTAKGVPAAASGAVIQHYIARWLQRRDRARAKELAQARKHTKTPSTTS